MTELLQEIERLGLVWRVSSAGVLVGGSRAEAMIRKPPKGQWVFGYGDTVEEALRAVLAKYQGLTGESRDVSDRSD